MCDKDCDNLDYVGSRGPQRDDGNTVHATSAINPVTLAGHTDGAFVKGVNSDIFHGLCLNLLSA